MLISSAIFLFAAAFIGIFSVITLLRAFFWRKHQYNLRLRSIKNRNLSEASLKKANILQPDRDAEISVFLKRTFTRLRIQSGWEENKRANILRLSALTLSLILALLWFTTNLLLTFLLTPFVIIISAFGYINFIRSKRIKHILQDLPNALDIINRSLKAGHPLGASIELVGREIDGPVGHEFAVISEKLRFGEAIDEAILTMFERTGAQEVKMMAIGISVQQGTGGNLTEVLTKLADMIRERLLLKNKIKAISSEGRITARVMLAFPFLLYFMVSAIIPNYFDPLWEAGLAKIIFGICGGLMIIGTLVLRKLINFDF